MPGEHFVLKDLPFYERAHEADAKARQERLNQREEKRQEGTLRKAPGEKGPALPRWSVLRPQRRRRRRRRRKRRRPLRRLSGWCLQLLIFRLRPASPGLADCITLLQSPRTPPAPRSLRLSARGLTPPNLSQTSLV